MPEGPEILYLCTFLTKKLKSSTIEKIISHVPTPILMDKNYIGEIINIDCKGKLLWIQVTGLHDNYWIHIHHGLTGWLTFDTDVKFIRYEFIINHQNKITKLFMDDKINFSSIEILTTDQHNLKVNSIGIDIFSKDFTYSKFKSIITNKKVILASFLLNQQYLSGIGNYIKNETMFLSNLCVKIKTNNMSEDDRFNLYNNILFVAYSNLYTLLGTLKKYLNPNKINDDIVCQIPYILQVYKQKQTPCGKPVIHIKVSSRDSYTINELL